VQLEHKVKFHSEELTFNEEENLYPLQEYVFGTDESETCPGAWRSGESKVGILPKLISVETKLQNFVAPAPVADQFQHAGHIWGPPDTSMLEPLQGSILEIRNDISNISKRINQIQRTNPDTNLVLYGVSETENSTETLIGNLVSTFAEKLKIQISPTQISATRIGNIKPPQRSRPRPVRIHFPASVDRLEIWKSRSRMKGTCRRVNQKKSRISLICCVMTERSS